MPETLDVITGCSVAVCADQCVWIFVRAGDGSEVHLGPFLPDQAQALADTLSTMAGQCERSAERVLN